MVILSAPRDVIRWYHLTTKAEVDYLLSNGYVWLDEMTLVPHVSPMRELLKLLR